MKEKIWYSVIGLTIFVLITIVVMLNSMTNAGKFMGLNPKAIYKEYKIYDIVEQKGLACAEVIEILDSDEKYDYYFNCAKSSKIYFVSDKETINVIEAYEKGIITKEELYKLGIVDRMERVNVE